MWMDNIKDWLNLSYKECIRNAENREKWRSITFNLLRADKTWWWWILQNVIFRMIILVCSFMWEKHVGRTKKSRYICCPRSQAENGTTSCTTPIKPSTWNIEHVLTLPFCISMDYNQGIKEFTVQFHKFILEHVASPNSWSQIVT